MLVMMAMKHSPETCPAYNSKYRDMSVKWFENVGSIAAKYGVKFVNSWTDHPMHTLYALFDTQSMDNMMKLAMDPEMSVGMAFNKIRTFPVLDHQQTLAIVKQSTG